uniref:Putative secreted protein n=1 Tax=Anopheles triannulatus TaxID=58253 RepID=A0A2M4B2G3_9DIPT
MRMMMNSIFVVTVGRWFLLLDSIASGGKVEGDRLRDGGRTRRGTVRSRGLLGTTAWVAATHRQERGRLPDRRGRGGSGTTVPIHAGNLTHRGRER